MYQALYRKYRPRLFSDVTGQEHITETLRRQISTDRLSHAYLFVGTRGTGKTTCAKILSRAVNCLNPEDGEPCNKCVSCVGIESGSILDVLEIDAASNNGVDNVRALRDEAVYSPASVNKRVYIIDEVHMLSTAAFNALLKILEEPPEHLMFILATTELHKVPATILSRCQRFSFRRLSQTSILSRLNQVAAGEALELSAEAAERLAVLADGSMRDGLSLLDQCATSEVIDLPKVLDTIGLAGQQDILRIADAAAQRDAASSLEILDALYNDGKDMAALLNDLASLFRDLLIFKLSADSPLLSGSFQRNELSLLSEKLTPERLFSYLEIVREAAFGLTRGGNVRVSVEMCLIRLCDERLSDDLSAILARVVKLETVRNCALNAECLMLNATPGAGGIHKIESPSTQKPTQDFVTDENVETKLSSDVACDSASDVGTDVGTDVGIDIVSDVDFDASEISNIAETPVEVEEPCDSPIDDKLSGDSGGVDFWQNILDALKDDVPVHSLLSDKTKIQAELNGKALTVYAGNPFIIQQIESKMFSDSIKDAAKKVLGCEILIHTAVPDRSKEENRRQKLESLRNLDFVNFED